MYTEAQKAYHREWYAKQSIERKMRKIELQKQRRHETREWLKTIKESLGCKRCSENHIACLDFHHSDANEKEFSLGEAIRRGYSKETIQREMDKCEVLCANCHRKLHHEEKSGSTEVAILPALEAGIRGFESHLPDS